jgi:tetratricopeptide (TPR) repeat protein
MPEWGTLLRSALAGGLAWIAIAGTPAIAAGDADDSTLCNNSVKDPDAGIAACTRLENSGPKGASAEVYKNRGNAWYVRTNYDAAISDYDKAINRNPRFTDAYHDRGLAWFKRGDFERAVKDFSDAIRLDPKRTRAYNDRGLALYNKGEYDLAIRDFSRSIDLDPRFAAAYSHRGLAWREKRKWDNALADYDRLIKLVPNDPAARINRALTWIDTGEIDRAIDDYNEAIRLDPASPVAYRARGEALRQKGDLDAALVDYDQAIRIDPLSVETYNNRALVWRDKKDFERAIADYDEAILANSQYAQAYAGRGEIWRLRGDLARSLTDLNKAVSLIPKHPYFLYLRGETLRQQGELDRAVADFSEAIRLLPQAVATYTARGLAYERKGELAKAQADFEHALQLPAVADAETAKPAQDTARGRLAALAELERAKVAELERAKVAAAEAERIRLALPAARAIPNQGRRIALVIGNSTYQNVPLLPNPRRDAEAIAASLQKIGFEKVRFEVDLSRVKMLRALQDFAAEAEQTDWALVYFAGHGLEMSGVNYLIPVDAVLASERDVQFEAVPFEQVLASVEAARKLKLVILDACRDNPYKNKMRRQMASRSVERGLARIEPEGGTLVVYAAKDGQVALDGDAEHSPFGAAFMRRLSEPGVEINKFFRLVRDDVIEATKGRQEPFTYGSLTGHEDFYFATK